MNKNEKGKIFRNSLKTLAGVTLASVVLTGAVNNNNNLYGDNISQTKEDNIINLPKGSGKIKPFEAWDYPCGNVESHWDYLSKQYEFWKKAGGLTSYDEYGFGVVNGSYVVAVTDKYGDIGDFILAELDDGTFIPCVIGDHEVKTDEDCNENGDIDIVLTFMVKTSKWYNKEYEDIAALKPEWYDKAVVSIFKSNVNYLESPFKQDLKIKDDKGNNGRIKTFEAWDYPSQEDISKDIEDEKNENINNRVNLSDDDEVLKITAIDYRKIPNGGFGDGIMLSRNGYYLLMDTFREECRPSLKKYLKDNNISKFDIYISHIHDDHIGNLYYCVDNYDVSKVYLPNLTDFDDIEKELKAKGVEVKRLEKGETFEIGDKDCMGEVIYGPNKKEGVSDNNSSLVSKITVETKKGGIDYLTGGDIEEETANDILNQGIDISADIMKADYHGGGDTAEYVKKVGASYYIYNYCKPDDDWIGKQKKAADENGNVLGTYKNGETSLSIKGSGEIVPIIEKNYEKVKFEVKDDDGEIIETVTYDLNIDSSHILTDQMKKTIIDRDDPR